MEKRAPVRLVGVLALACLAPVLSSCSLVGQPDLVVYNAQHEELMAEIVPRFEEETGLDVELRNGKDLELANQLVAEGEDSPADVFLTENSPAMSIVDNAGLFTKVSDRALADIPAEYVPGSQNWIGILARSTVVMYNTDLTSEQEMPDSILDLADPEWEGRIGFSPTGHDFQAIVSAVLASEGESATARWLEGLRDNGTVLDNNLVVMQSVNEGDIEAGIAYHYYYYRDQAEAGDNSDNVALHYFGDQDPGAFVSISGAGVLASGEHQDDAQRFVEYLTSAEAQQAMADSYALEYPLNPDVRLSDDSGVRPFDVLEPPAIDPATLNGPQVTELMTEAGLL